MAPTIHRHQHTMQSSKQCTRNTSRDVTAGRGFEVCWEKRREARRQQTKLTNEPNVCFSPGDDEVAKIGFQNVSPTST